LEIRNRYRDGSGICHQNDILRVEIGKELKMIELARKGVRAMYEEFERGSEVLKEREKVLVPVRRHEAEKEAELEIQKKPRLAEQWQIPQRWYIS
jgi:hypothetical protein